MLTGSKKRYYSFVHDAVGHDHCDILHHMFSNYIDTSDGVKLIDVNFYRAEAKTREVLGFGKLLERQQLLISLPLSP